MSERDRLRRAFEDSYDLRPEPGLRHRAIRYAVTSGRDRTPRAWGLALAGALALLVIGVLVVPRLLHHQGAGTPAGRPTPTPVPTASAPAPPGPSPQIVRGVMGTDAGGRVVLFGSTAPTDANGQTWTWDGAHWTAVAGPQPPARTNAAGAFDGQGFVIFGGQGACPSGPGACPTLGDTWRFDGRAWQQLHPAHSPAPAVGALMAWDPALGKAVLVVDVASGTGGMQTWTWDGSDWSQPIAAARGGPMAFGAALGYDPVSRRLVLYGELVRNGSQTATPGTWTYDGQWSQAPGGPGVRQFPAMADDGSHLYLVGGADTNGQAQGDTWEWTGSAWQRLSPAHQPPPRQEARMAPGQARVTLYGGFASETQTNAAPLADTWVYDGRDWTQKAG